MATAFAPSIYAFRSEMEWETAMAEWLAENEPKYNLSKFDPEVGHDVPVFASDLDLFPKVQYGPRYPKRYTAPGRAPLAGYCDHRPGGSRADYRMAGITKY